MLVTPKRMGKDKSRPFVRQTVNRSGPGRELVGLFRQLKEWRKLPSKNVWQLPEVGFVILIEHDPDTADLW
ncbi:hypothetical protein GCM10028773_61290 [Spirosoma koreense]